MAGTTLQGALADLALEPLVRFLAENGLVNGKPITAETELRGGDQIEMGQVLFRFESLS